MPDDCWLAPGLALILDMDGVVIDSNPFHRQAWTRYNRGFGIETTAAMQARIYGRRNDQIVRDFFGDHLPATEIAAHGAAKERLYREMVGDRLEALLVPGLRAFLDRHAARPIGLATNAEPDNVEFLLATAGLRAYFRAVVDGHQVTRAKPDPEIFLRTAALLGAPPGACVVFEDSVWGLRAARAAGMRTVGLRTTHSELRDADLGIDNFLSPELEPWLRAQKPDERPA